MSILNDQEIHQIVHSYTRDPFHFLGMHFLNENEIVVRCFNPAAKKVTLLSEELENDLELKKIHHDGLFEKVFDNDKLISYSFKLEGYNDNYWETEDPYMFEPILTEYDTYLFNEGNHHRIYRKMGAHIKTIQGIIGTHFSVWAPEAERVSVVGGFNSWDGRVHQMRMLGSSGVWEIFIPRVGEGELYRFEVKSKSGDILVKSDPYAFHSETRPANASVVYDIVDKYTWSDDDWMEKRRETNWLEKPVSTYEIHLGSWARKGDDGNQFLTYDDYADQLVDYVIKNNFTHVELMSIAEHPLDESWGYQVSGYFSATSRFGKPEGLKKLIDKLHQNNIGVILDWVPGHFPKDAFGLGRFDGTAVYEHEDPRQGEHSEWGTYIFNYGRNEVKNFLITNALFWFDEFHMDGLRVDAVASMLYLDYSRNDGEWIPNKYGGRENLEAIEFLKYFNSISHEYYPGIITIAEESTAFPGVTNPTYLGGLGFSLKWNMGWMHDSLEYIAKDPIYRRYHHNNLTFSLVYAFTENFMLVLSHDEVVHGKGSMLNKMPGDYWQKFANLRLFLAYSYAHPGKKLNFMGFEIGQWSEWSATKSLDWHLLEYESHKNMQRYVKSLNEIYKNSPSLYELDFSHEGFQWIDFHDSDNSVISFIRKSKDEREITACIFNFTPVPLFEYRLGVPFEGYYEEVLNTDAIEFWGCNVGNFGGVNSEPTSWQGFSNSIQIAVPPLGGVYFKFIK